MFASAIAKTPTQTAASSATGRTLRRAPLARQGSGRDILQPARMRQRPLGNQAMLRLLAQQAASQSETQSRSVASPLPGMLQPKLEIGAVDDPLEHEADRVAGQVMRMPDPDLAIAAASPQISRKCAACEEDEEAQTMQTKQDGTFATPGEAPAIVHETLRSPGQPLDTGTRGFMESRFDRDFSQVRIHTDTLAGDSARAVGAHAYTVGTNVVFGPGEFAPSSDSGRKLIAHELAHVIQQVGTTNRSTAARIQVQRAPEEGTPGNDDGTATTSINSSQVKDISKIKPGIDIDVADGRAFALAAIAAMSPYGAVVSEPPSDAVAAVDSNPVGTVAANDTGTSGTETLQTSALNPIVQRSGGGRVTPEAGFIGSVQLCYDACNGEISVVGWIWAGGGVVTKGLFGGKSWWGAYVFAEGELLKPKKLDFMPTLNCGTCAPGCKPDDGFNWGGGIGGFPVVLKPGERASLKQAGIEVGALLTPHPCAADLEIIALMDLTKYLGPLGSAVVAAEELANKLGKKFGIKIECGVGVDVSGKIQLCKSVSGGITADSAKICGGGYVGCGIGLEHDKSALPSV